ncbi:MAG: RodZ domain-containing protein [Solidesulfovibrio sp.]
MDLRELGAMLREERERQGLSVEAVADQIKITRTCLAAIEEGNESVLPHPVYAKGFVKNYARVLGVADAAFAKKLAEVYTLEDPALHDVPIIRDLPDDDCGCEIGSSRGRLRPGRVVLAVVGLIALAGLGWYGYAHYLAKPATDVPSDKAAVETAAPVVSSTPAPTPEPVKPEPVAPAPVPVVQPSTPDPATEPKVSGTTPAAQDAKSRVAPTPEDQVTQDIATSGPTTPAASTVPPAPEGASETPATAPGASTKSFTVGDRGSHVVSIVANERCWLQAGADGGTMRETMLEKGDTFTGRFADNMLVRLGNAGAVEIRFDNKLYPLQAGKGSVKTLKFVAKKTEDEAARTGTPADAAAPAPAATPAPAPAPVVPTVSQAPAAIAPTPGGETAQGAKEVEIFGQDGSWVIVSPDKGPAKEIYVKKGQRITVPFGDKIDIKLGNPSNVIFRYDGKETPVTTEKGASRTIRFPSTGTN